MSFFKRLFGRNDKPDFGEDQIVKVKDLRKNWKFDFNGKTWRVTDMAVYTWDNGVEDLEWTIKDDKGRIEYLNYESVSENVSVYREANINNVWKNAKRCMAVDEMSDKTFEYKEREYSYLDEGSARVRNSEEAYTMANWLFGDTSGTHFVSFNSYEDNTKDCYIGEAVSDNDIKNIQRAIIK